jgi:hypothetical protein
MTTNPALADLQFLVGAWDMELSEASPGSTTSRSVTAGSRDSELR